MNASEHGEIQGIRGFWQCLRRSPSSLAIVLLIPLMLLELVGITAEGFKRYPSFEGAVMLMAGTLALVWNVFGGSVMFLARNRVRGLVLKSPLGKGTTFVLFAIALALLEEVVTTTLTNLAPVFGSSQAFITTSRNYFEVVIWHSVIVIAPMFVVWAWLLRRYRFTSSSVFLLFGLNGVLAEFLLGGGLAVLMAPFWIFVYGLMVFLPAYSYPVDGLAAKARWYHGVGAVLGCLLASLVVAIPVNLLSPHLPHFGETLAFPKTSLHPSGARAAGRNYPRSKAEIVGRPSTNPSGIRQNAPPAGLKDKVYFNRGTG